MKITAVFWYLWSACLVFSFPQRRYRYYDDVRMEIKQDSKAHDVSMNLPDQAPTAVVAHDAATFKFLLPKRPAAPSLKDFKTHDASMDLPEQRPISLVAHDAATFKFLLPKRPAAPPLKDSKAFDASMDLPEQRPTSLAHQDRATVWLPRLEGPEPPPLKDSKAFDASMDLPEQRPTSLVAHDAATFKFLLPKRPAAPPLKDSKAFDASMDLPEQRPTSLAHQDRATVWLPRLEGPEPPVAYDAAMLKFLQPKRQVVPRLKDPKAFDASMDLPEQLPTSLVLQDGATVWFAQPEGLEASVHKALDGALGLPDQVPTSRVAQDAATFKFLLPKRPAALSSKDDAAYEDLALRSPTLIKNSDAQAGQRRLPHWSQSVPGHVSSDVSNDYYEEENLQYFDEDTEDSLYPGAEEYVTEEEVVNANDAIELTDDFLKDYLGNEDLDIEADSDTETE